MICSAQSVGYQAIESSIIFKHNFLSARTRGYGWVCVQWVMRQKEKEKLLHEYKYILDDILYMPTIYMYVYIMIG